MRCHLSVNLVLFPASSWPAESAAFLARMSPHPRFSRVLDELLKTGVRQHQAGRLSEAKQAYEQILAIDPSHPEALHLLGVVALQGGDATRAVDLIQRALQKQPRNWQYLLNLAHGHAALHHFADAHS